MSVYDICHHNIIFGTVKLLWDYKNAEINSIQKAISTFDWRKAFKDKCKRDQQNTNGYFNEYFWKLYLP